MSYSISLLKFMTFVDLFAVGLICPLVPAHIRSMGASHLAVGALGSVYSGFQLGSGPVMGSLSDIKGRKNILILTLILSAVSYIVIGITHSVGLIILMRGVLGIFKQTQMLCRAMVPDYEKRPKVQSAIYGKMAAISGMGITIGPLIGGHIIDDYPDNGFMIIGLAVGACFFLNAGLAFMLPNVDNVRKSRSEAEVGLGHSKSILHSIGHSLKQSVIVLFSIDWSKFWDVFLLKVFVGFAMSIYYSNYSLFLNTEFELSRKKIGYIISFQGVIGSVSSYFMANINSLYTHDETYAVRNFHVFVLVFGSFIGLLLSSNVYAYVFWLTPLAIGNAVGRLVSLEMLLKRGQNTHRGTLIGASNSVRALTGVVAPMVAGYISQYSGVTYVIYASICSSLLGLFVSLHSLNKTVRIKED